MELLSVKSSRSKYFLLLICSLTFVAGGIFILSEGNAKGWMPTIFFGACALVFIWQIYDQRPRLIISEEGIYDRTLGVGIIPWRDIEGGYVRSVHSNDFICLELREPSRYLPKLSKVKKAMIKANEKLGFTPFSINLSGLPVDTDQVVELMMKMTEIKKGEQVVADYRGFSRHLNAAEQEKHPG